MWVSIFVGLYHTEGFDSSIWCCYCFHSFLQLIYTAPPPRILRGQVVRSNAVRVWMANAGIYEISKFFVATLGCGLCASVNMSVVLVSKYVYLFFCECVYVWNAWKCMMVLLPPTLATLELFRLLCHHLVMEKLKCLSKQKTGYNCY